MRASGGRAVHWVGGGVFAARHQYLRTGQHAVSTHIFAAVQALANSIVLTSLGGVAAVALSVAAAAGIPIRLRVALPVPMHPNPTRTSKYMQVAYKHLNMDECDSECQYGAESCVCDGVGTNFKPELRRLITDSELDVSVLASRVTAAAKPPEGGAAGEPASIVAGGDSIASVPPLAEGLPVPEELGPAGWWRRFRCVSGRSAGSSSSSSSDSLARLKLRLVPRRRCFLLVLAECCG
jgi:hypothetical protein